MLCPERAPEVIEDSGAPSGNAVKDFELDRKLGNLRYFPEKNRGLSEISLHDVAIKAPFFLETTQINAEKILNGVALQGTRPTNRISQGGARVRLLALG